MNADTAPRPHDARGRLLLVPNTLDLGTTAQAITTVLPAAVLHEAARLGHWLAEDAKSTRAFLKRVHDVVPLAAPLQSVVITELPRPPKGGGRPSGPSRGPAGPAGTPGPAGAGGAAGSAVGAGPATGPMLLAPALAGHDIGLLSEAGLPAVADPGATVVAAAHALGLQVVPLAGPSSLMLALAASGLDGQSFAFVGYLPQEPAARAARIRALEAQSQRVHQTQIFIETPYRNAALLRALLEIAAPATKLSVSVGLTLPGGFSRTATIAQWRQRMKEAAEPLPDRLPAVFLLQA